MGEKNKTCATITLFINFSRATVMEQGVNLYANRLVCNCLLQVWKNLFIVLKIRSHAKLTCIFVNCDTARPVVVNVVRSLRILHSLVT